MTSILGEDGDGCDGCVHVSTHVWTDTQTGVAEGQVGSEKRGNRSITAASADNVTPFVFLPKE